MLFHILILMLDRWIGNYTSSSLSLRARNASFAAACSEAFLERP